MITKMLPTPLKVPTIPYSVIFDLALPADDARRLYCKLVKYTREDLRGFFAGVAGNQIIIRDGDGRFPNEVSKTLKLYGIPFRRSQTGIINLDSQISVEPYDLSSRTIVEKFMVE